MSNEVANALRLAKNLIDTPGKWGQGPAYKRSNRDSMCAGEAIDALNLPHQARIGAFYALGETVGWPVALWNDRATHSEVMAGFDKAIEAQLD